MVCYKETWAGKKIDPSAEWTGTWMDNEIVGSVPQNALTGQLYRVVSPTYAIVIPYPLTLHPNLGKHPDSQHRARGIIQNSKRLLGV
jgi:hypothetical protein